jgi:outer membrane biosynthesis protein TonB
MAKLQPPVVVCALVASCFAAAGCSRLSARTVPPPPALDVPAPPPRVVEASDSEPPPPGTLVEAPASSAPSNRRQPPRVEVPKPAEPPKPEPTPAPVTETVPAPEPARPATTLATTPPEREAALESEIKSKLQRALRDLNRVDYGRLNENAKAEYDRAKRFATQADEALKAKNNLVFARQLADNAANIAAQLANR